MYQPREIDQKFCINARNSLRLSKCKLMFLILLLLSDAANAIRREFKTRDFSILG